MAASKVINPGTDNQPVGTYKEVWPRGEEISHPRIVSIYLGDRLLTTSKSGNCWTKD